MYIYEKPNDLKCLTQMLKYFQFLNSCIARLYKGKENTHIFLMFTNNIVLLDNIIFFIFFIDFKTVNTAFVLLGFFLSGGQESS